MPQTTDQSTDTPPEDTPTGVRIGHVNLKVADLDRALTFYRDVLDFKVTKRIGDAAAFLAHGSYHHDICINTWQSAGGAPPAPGTTGLYHFAILYPTRRALGQALLRLQAAGWPIDSAIDHGVGLSLYLRDPDGNGVELAWDRSPDHWRGSAGELIMGHRPIEPDAILHATDEGSRGMAATD